MKKGLDPDKAVGELSGTLDPDGFVRISGNISGRLASDVSNLPLTISWTSQKE